MSGYLALLPFLLLIVAACGTTDSEGPDSPLASWSIAGEDHPVVSGIAGAQPAYWLDRGWEGEATLVYLVDQELTCDDFPFVATPNAFPPVLVAEGAYIMLRFVVDGSDGVVNYASFDVQTAGSTTGSSTGDVSGSNTVVGTDGSRRAQGWIEYDTAGEGSPGLSVSASGTFDVAFCE
jgi:hypothetical protein